MKVPRSHPRYMSLKTRELIVRGVAKGVTSKHGLIAHGRGEAFDYLLGEKTHDFAKKAIDGAAALLLLAKHPIISVNGNTAALAPKELVALSKLLNVSLEVNLFHGSKERETKIKNYLLKHGAKQILLPQKKAKVQFLASNRRYVSENGILQADVVFVPLEDGDRTEALMKNGKKVITVDLNPLSRTAQKASITIVDNIVRALPLLLKRVKTFKKYKREKLEEIIINYNNKVLLTKAIIYIRRLQ